MSEKNIVLIPGDGIGTEIIAAAKAVCDVAFEKAGVKVNWIDKKAGGASIDAYGVPLTEDTIELPSLARLSTMRYVAAVKASLNRAHSQWGETRNQVIYTWPG